MQERLKGEYAKGFLSSSTALQNIVCNLLIIFYMNYVQLSIIHRFRRYFFPHEMLSKVRINIISLYYLNLSYFLSDQSGLYLVFPKYNKKIFN